MAVTAVEAASKPSPARLGGGGLIGGTRVGFFRVVRLAERKLVAQERTRFALDSHHKALTLNHPIDDVAVVPLLFQPILPALFEQLRLPLGLGIEHPAQRGRP